MRNWFHKVLAKNTGRNLESTPQAVIAVQLTEPRELPMGRKAFHEWSDRIIAGAMITADPQSLKFALSDLLLHLGPTESHKPDAFFIHSLRKFAVNQVAIAMRQELKDEHEAKKKAAEEEAKLKLVKDTDGNQQEQASTDQGEDRTHAEGGR